MKIKTFRPLLLLVVIYLAFISLGLPDSLLGSAWPVMYSDLQVPADYAGFISMIIAAATVISSLLSNRIIRRFGVAWVTIVSVLMTALALLGFSYSHHFLYLCFLAIPLGLGAGSVDTALNNYVALHYKALHMNWLHCFWGVGAAIGTIIMAGYLTRGESWMKGYHTIGWIQMSLVVILFLSLPLWIQNRRKEEDPETAVAKTSFKTLLKLPGFKQVLVVFFCYCAIETTFGLWGASYLVFVRHFEPERAAKYAAIYYLGITIGRFLSGIVTLKFSNRQLIYIGQAIIAFGIFSLWLPFETILLPAFFLIGLGCAPVFPSLIHETPRNFGKKYSQAIIGIQMASAYVGITLMPLLFGKIGSLLGFSSLLWFLGIVLVIKSWVNFDLNRKVDHRRIEEKQL